MIINLLDDPLLHCRLVTHAEPLVTVNSCGTPYDKTWQCSLLNANLSPINITVCVKLFLNKKKEKNDKTRIRYNGWVCVADAAPVRAKSGVWGRYISHQKVSKPKCAYMHVRRMKAPLAQAKFSIYIHVVKNTTNQLKKSNYCFKPDMIRTYLYNATIKSLK